jgi:hypothetical protein
MPTVTLSGDIIFKKVNDILGFEPQGIKDPSGAYADKVVWSDAIIENLAKVLLKSN